MASATAIQPASLITWGQRIPSNLGVNGAWSSQQTAAALNRRRLFQDPADQLSHHPAVGRTRRPTPADAIAGHSRTPQAIFIDQQRWGPTDRSATSDARIIETKRQDWRPQRVTRDPFLRPSPP